MGTASSNLLSTIIGNSAVKTQVGDINIMTDVSQVVNYADITNGIDSDDDGCVLIFENNPKPVEIFNKKHCKNVLNVFEKLKKDNN